MAEVQKTSDSTFNRMKQRLSPRVIVAIIIAVLAVILITQNTHDAQVHLFFWHIDRPLWLMLLLLFAAGFIVGSIYPWFHRRQKRTPGSPPSTN